MSTVFLSPSAQRENEYVTGNGSEAKFMNLLADAIEPYLLLNGISYARSDSGDTVNDAIRKSNAYDPSLHVALHSNAAPDSAPGSLQGPEVYYYRNSTKGKQAAEDIAQQLTAIYPYGDTALTIPVNRELAELVRTKAPSVFIETAYHDNPQDAAWIEQNINEIAEAIARGITDYFGTPFIGTEGAELGRVRLQSGTLNVRSAPNTNSRVIGALRNGSPVLILRTLPDWYYVVGNNTAGYVSSRFIERT